MKPELTPEVREYFRRLRGSGGAGWAGWTSDQHRELAILTAEARWKLRRYRYGPTGHRKRSYKQWKEDHPNYFVDKGVK